jgi:RND family efflux transporter MFP subunit
MLRPAVLLALVCSSLNAFGAAAPAAPAFASEHDCMLEPRQHVEIRSPVEAMISTVRVRRGDVVTRGQVLATLESGPERASLDLAQSRALMAGEIKVAQARLDIAQKKLKRADELALENFISANARDESEADFRLASEEFGRARENQRLAELDVKRAVEVVSLRTIRSPLNGVVVEVLLRPGEFGATTIKDPIMKLAEIDPLHVEVVLPVALFGTIRQGQKAVVMPERPVGGRYETAVKVVDRIVDAASGTFGVRLELPNRKQTIPSGVRCRVQFL